MPNGGYGMIFVMSLRCCRCWLRRTSLANYVITSPRWYEPFLQVRGRLASNPELDALLQYYAYEAERAGVRFTSRIETPVDHFAKSVDLTVVLGNLLENAVQAAGCCAGERYADLRIGKVPGVCMIQVRNSYDGLIDERNGRFLSTKHNGMGMGLESVRLTAQRLHGECSVKHDGHVFTVRVSLPM